MASKVEQLIIRKLAAEEKLAALEAQLTDAQLEEVSEEELTQMIGQVSDGIVAYAVEALDGAGLELPIGKSVEFHPIDAEIVAALWPGVKGIFTDANVELPASKLIKLTAGETGLSVSVTDAAKSKGKRKSGGNGGNRKLTIPSEVIADFGLTGEETSWAQVCDTLNIGYAGQSAHRVLWAENRELHDAIPHEEPSPDYHPKNGGKKVEEVGEVTEE